VHVVLLFFGAAGQLCAQPISYTIDSETSTLAFNVTHMGVLKVDGVFQTAVGEVLFDPSSPDSMRARIQIQAASVFTGNTLRDRSLRSDEFLDAERYPTIEYRSTHVMRSDIDGAFLVSGELTLQGSEYAIDFRATVDTLNAAGQTLKVLSDFTFNRHDVGLTFGRAMDSLVGEEVRVHVILEAGAPMND